MKINIPNKALSHKILYGGCNANALPGGAAGVFKYYDWVHQARLVYGAWKLSFTPVKRELERIRYW